MTTLRTVPLVAPEMLADHDKMRSNGKTSAAEDTSARVAWGGMRGSLVAEHDPYPYTDLGNARRLVACHGQDLHHAPQLGTWLVWDGQRWRCDITGEVERRAKAVVDGLLVEAHAAAGKARDELLSAYKNSSNVSRLRAMVDLARTEPGIPVTIDQLDADPFLLNVTNGIVDLRTGELLPHDRTRLCTKLAGTAYLPDATAPCWERFVAEIFDGDTDLISFVQRFGGYSLTGDVREQLLLFAYGVGSNGKSTMLTTLRLVAGDYGMHLDPRVLTVSHHDEHPTALTDLRGARLVVTIETEAGRQLAEALVKSLTGGDPIRARRMRGDYFEFMPSHKLIIAGNHLPPVRGTDVGIWRRIGVVPFEVVFDDDRRDKELPAKARGGGTRNPRLGCAGLPRVAERRPADPGPCSTGYVELPGLRGPHRPLHRRRLRNRRRPLGSCSTTSWRLRVLVRGDGRASLDCQSRRCRAQGPWFRHGAEGSGAHPLMARTWAPRREG